MADEATASASVPGIATGRKSDLIGDNDQGEVADVVARLIEEDGVVESAEGKGGVVAFQAVEDIEPFLPCPLQGMAVNDPTGYSGGTVGAVRVDSGDDHFGRPSELQGCAQYQLLVSAALSVFP